MKRGPYGRTVRADIRILIVFDSGEYSYKEVAMIVGVSERDVDNAIRRRKRFPERYVPRKTTLRDVTGKRQ